MKIFMLGWEFPPFISGGLGTACYGLTKAMSQLGLEVTFVLPRICDEQYSGHVKVLGPGSLSSKPGFDFESLPSVKVHKIDSPLQAYDTGGIYKSRLEHILKLKRLVSDPDGCELDPAVGELNYGSDMYSEVYRYASMAARLAEDEQFDVIHAHDWMTFPAGIAVAEATHKPLIVHVHSTEFDRSGEHVNQMVYDIERAGMQRADRVITVSNFTRNITLSRYGIDSHKVDVVYNGVNRSPVDSRHLSEGEVKKDEKIVLFLGRITMQKGPEYFIQAAKRVLEVTENVKFVVAGSGDLMHSAVRRAAELGIGGKVLFTGFLRGQAVEQIYRMADLYVMPSVSEPFGIVPLEALGNDVPAIISRQSGVSEVLSHVLKVDFWDVEEMANKIVAVLSYPALKNTLRDYGNSEVRRLHWNRAAEGCIRVYEKLLTAV